MTNDGTNTYTYDAEGNITAVSVGTSATYIYNASNQRVRTVANGATTEFVFNARGQRVSEWNGTTRAQLKGKYYWGGRPVAYYTTAASGSAGAHFEHQDWLGTERMRTTYNSGNNPTYAVEASYTSQPWGDAQTPAANGTDASHYATLDHDAETETDHAQFRQYANEQGHFMSPDPYSGSYDFSNPQSFNRYVYALDNPLSYLDPSGLDCVYDEGGGTIWVKAGDCINAGGVNDSGAYFDCGSIGAADGCLVNATAIYSLATGNLSFSDVDGNIIGQIQGWGAASPSAAVTVTVNGDTGQVFWAYYIDSGASYANVAPAPNSGLPQPQHFWQKPGCGSSIGQTALGLAGSAVEVGAVIFVGPELLAAAGAEAGGAALLEGGELVESGMSVAHVATGLGTLLAAPAVLTANGTMGIFKNCF